MVRTPCCDKNGLKKGPWTPEEDRKLIDYVTKYGHWNWRLLPKFAGLARCGKSCRLRWLNYLRPDVKRGNFSHEEEETIVRLHEKLGNRWSAIAAELPGRTDNEIKNHWHTALKKRFERKPKAKRRTEKEGNVVSKSMERVVLENCSEYAVITTDAAAAITNHENSVLEGDDYGLSFLDTYTEPDVCANFWTEPYLIDNSYVPPEGDVVELWSHNDLYMHEYCEGFFC